MKNYENILDVLYPGCKNIKISRTLLPHSTISQNILVFFVFLFFISFVLWFIYFFRNEPSKNAKLSHLPLAKYK